MRILALLALSSTLLLPVAVHADDADRRRAVTVEGEGRVSAAPDEASIALGVEARSADLAAARKDVNARTAAVLAHLDTLAIAPADISAPGLTLRPQYRWDKAREQQVLKGYLVERRIDVRLRDLGQLGVLIEGVADAGANKVSPPTLGHSDAAGLRREALAEAARDARANATALAESLGVAVGPVRTLDALNSPRPRPVASEMAVRSAGAAPAAESYGTGDLVFQSRVNATFDLRVPGV